MTALASFVAAHPTAIRVVGIAMGIAGLGFLVGYPLCRLAIGVWIKLHEDDVEVQR